MSRARRWHRTAARVAALALLTGGGLAAATAAPAAAADVLPVGGAWTVKGKGFGHGHGLSQWGAQSRAADGQSARQILEAYYPGTGSATHPGRELDVGLTAWTAGTVRLRSTGGHQLAVSTTGTRVNADQVLELVRSGSSIKGTWVNPGGARVRTETWSSTPRVSAANHQVALVRSDGTGTVVQGTVSAPTGSGSITPVNRLHLEDYVRGVVPNESPASWRPAALQAQAVAARSYALATLRTSGSWDTCDSTSCQVYKGWARRAAGGALTSLQPASTNAAVSATAGQYRTWGGKAAFTQFSASNGGWSSPGSVPYLAANADPWSARTGSTSGDALANWTAKLTVDEVSRRCPSGGRATSLAVTGRDGRGDLGGRVTSLRVRCTTGDVTLTGAGSVRFSLRSTWWAPVSTPSGGAIDAAHAHFGGASGFLGAPVVDETPTPRVRGAYRHYRGGSVYWSPGTGAHELHGPVRDLWAAKGWEHSDVGFPTTSQLATPDGGGRYNHFADGSIYWTAATGAHSVRRQSRDTWAALGWERSALRYPTSEPGTAPDGRGRYQHFQGGSIYYTPSTGARAVTGPVHTAWSGWGWERSPLGYPTAHTGRTPDGVGAYTHFEKGSVYWTRATGARYVLGKARTAWAGLGWERSALGYPTASTAPAPGGDGTVTRFQGGTVTVSAAGLVTVTPTPAPTSTPTPTPAPTP